VKNQWELKITDNGKGFSTTEIPANKFGLAMLKERVYKVNGKIEIISKHGVGTEIIIKGGKE
jgi:signal transduction histidine kinase